MPMMIMPSNLVTRAEKWEAKHPGRMGLLFSPSAGWHDPRGLPYALDNGRFSVWSKGAEWSAREFKKMLAWAQKQSRPPLWVAVPDVVADATQTLAWWDKWTPRLSPYGWPLALVVQDGMTVDDVTALQRRPDVIFVGGTTNWKRRTLQIWCRNFPRVHVGRVNTEGMLWACHQAGAESTDGTGWWRPGKSVELERYLERSSRNLVAGCSLVEPLKRNPRPN